MISRRVLSAWEIDTCMYSLEKSNSVFSYLLCLNCLFNNHQFISNINRNGSVLSLLFSRLNMDHVLSFTFSLLLISLVTTTAFGSDFKANNPNGEVTFYCLWSNFLFATLYGVSLCYCQAWHLVSGPFGSHSWKLHEKWKSEGKLAFTTRDA